MLGVALSLSHIDTAADETSSFRARSACLRFARSLQWVIRSESFTPRY